MLVKLVKIQIMPSVVDFRLPRCDGDLRPLRRTQPGGGFENYHISRCLCDFTAPLAEYSSIHG